MKYLNTYKLFESLVDKKIQLLKDLALDLEDIGLEVDIINGSKKIWQSTIRMKNSHYIDISWDDNKYIIMLIVDDGNITKKLYESDIISYFEETLRSFKMNYRKMSAGDKHVVYRFDKHGKMTDSPLIRN